MTGQIQKDKTRKVLLSAVAVAAFLSCLNFYFRGILLKKSIEFADSRVYDASAGTASEIEMFRGNEKLFLTMLVEFSWLSIQLIILLTSTYVIVRSIRNKPQ